MQRIVVTVKRYGEARVRDLEVPADVEVKRLTQLISEALRWGSDPAGQRLEYEIEANPPGRKLDPGESLQTAGVWDGAWLVFHPLGQPAPRPAPPPAPKRAAPPPPPAARPVAPAPPLPFPKPAAPAPPPAGSSPVSGFRSLGIPLPGGASQQPDPDSDDEPTLGEARKGAEGFVWKQLD